MECKGYKILRGVNIEDPSADVGKPMAFSFNYGIIRSEIYGETQLTGSIPCFLRYEDKEALLRAQPLSTYTLDEVLADILEDTRSVGYEVTMEFINSKFNIQENGLGSIWSCDLVDILSIAFPSIPLPEMKIMFLTFCFTIALDDAVEQAVGNAEDLAKTFATLGSILQGEITHLRQIAIKGIPDHFSLAFVFLILIRQEGLRKSRTAWLPLKKDYSDFLAAMAVEHQKTFLTVQEYLDFRLFSGAGLVIVEVNWMAGGLEIPDRVREHSVFLQFKSIGSLFGVLVNDIQSLGKEIRAGESHNIVLIIAKTKNLGLQGGLKACLSLLESFFYRTQECARKLLKTFQGEPIVRRMIESTFRMLDNQLAFHEMFQYRYGLEGTSSYHIVQHNEFYSEQEHDMEKCLKEMGNLESNNSLEINIKSPNERNQAPQNGPSDKISYRPPIVANEHRIPLHVAIIPDGNRRWAKAKGLDPWEGHIESGVVIAKKLIRHLWDRGVNTITIWLLSPDNFGRPQEELQHLWIVFEKFAVQARETCNEYGARMCHIGNLHRLPLRIARILRKNEEETQMRTGACLTTAIDYGGIDEIVDAIRHSGVSLESISVQTITHNLYGARKDIPHPTPHLIVRTGCKDAKTVRTSGFMTWQSSSAEFYFESKYMPECKEADLDAWIDAYGTSEQRCGK